jgi:uncharacterized protein YcbX
MFEFLFQLASIILMAASVWCWHRALSVEPPESLGVSVLADGEDPLGDNEEKSWHRELTAKNRDAAAATAVSIFFQMAAQLSSLAAL